MQIIAIQFPARRYHATPWDAHVNEGRIEWPPSPWRLIRALLAVGYNKLGWTDELNEDAKAVVAKLSSVMPDYSLPAATEAHTRHYMPTRDKTAKVFDAFLRFVHSDNELLVRFDAELDSIQRQTLDQMVSGLTYLGRAESWTEARLLSQDEAVKASQTQTWYCPNEQGDGRPVRLLAALAVAEYAQWREQQVAQAADALERLARQTHESKGKRVSPTAVKQARAKAEGNYPQDILAALQLETSTWQSQGWPRPPGSHWVDYQIPEKLLQQRPLTTLAVSPKAKPIQAVLLAVDGDGKRGTVRPLMKRALPLMELLHNESVRKATRDLGLGNVPELTGKHDDGSILRGHQHAHWLPMSMFGQEMIDHVLVYCPSNFSSKAIASLAAIRWAYAKGIDRLSINMAGMGSVPEMANQLSTTATCRRQGLSPIEQSTHWESVTPLVMRKYVHSRGKKTPEGQIREELLQRGFPQPVQIEMLPQQTLVLNRLKGWVLARAIGKQQPPHIASWGAKIQFDQPIRGPLSLGYASHFGLGLFGAREKLSIESDE